MLYFIGFHTSEGVFRDEDRFCSVDRDLLIHRKHSVSVKIQKSNDHHRPLYFFPIPVPIYVVIVAIPIVSSSLVVRTIPIGLLVLGYNMQNELSESKANAEPFSGLPDSSNFMRIHTIQASNTACKVRQAIFVLKHVTNEARRAVQSAI